MDFNRKQLDSLSLGFYRSVISHKDNPYEKDQFRVNYEMFKEQNAISIFCIIKLVKLSQRI